MNIKNVVLCGLGLLMGVSATAQINILNAKTPEEIGKKTESQIAYDPHWPSHRRQQACHVADRSLAVRTILHIYPLGLPNQVNQVGR